MRIVYCLDSIRGIGGIQRVTVAKANALAAMPGNEVWILVADTSGVQVYDVSPEVHIMDLDIRYYDDDWKSGWYVLKGLVFKRNTHRKRIREAFGNIRPDVVISVGQSEKNFLAGLKGNWLKIREIHFTKNYRMLAARTFFSKVLAIGGDLYDYHWKIRDYDRIVVLTEEDRQDCWKGNDKVRVIPDPLPFGRSDVSSLENKTVIAVGRLTAQKNFLSLLHAFRLVSKRFPDWHLEILGEGEQRQILADEINQLSLSGRVLLKGAVRDVRSELLSASCLVLSSSFEGFGMALTEAMACGLPVVSYSCPAGPKDIITDAVDGFLVTPGDEAGLAERICDIIADPDRRRRMGQAAFKSSARYEMDRILPQWMDLFEGRC